MTLIGIGIQAGDLSLKALNKAKEADVVLLRTSLTESGKYVLSALHNVRSLDFVYEKSRNFDTLSKNLAKEVLNLAKDKNVVYMVDGDVCSDLSCKIILQKRKDAEIINGVSRASAYASHLGFSSFTSISAYDLENTELSLPLIVTDIDGSFIASKSKLFLSDLFGDEIEIYKIKNDYIKKIRLYELDFDDDFDYSSAIAIDKLSFLQKTRFSVRDLREILKSLRGENGCPWDREQTPTSIKMNTIEETYELLDAIDRNDEDGIIEELGDVLLQVMFQIQFGEERSAFTYEDVISSICEKLISRHTHIFGKDRVNSADEALSLWDKNKRKEKGFINGGEYLDSIPKNFPALMRAQKAGKRASKYNFDFSDKKQIISKIYEEIDEIAEAEKTGNQNKIKEEYGDLLFSAVNLARKSGVDAEEALTISVNKFIERFKKLEQAISADGKNIKNLSEEEIDEYYNEIKKN